MLISNFPQFIVIYIVKGVGIINKAEVDVFLQKLSALEGINSICALL